MERTKHTLTDDLIYELFNSDGGYFTINKKAIKILGHPLAALLLGNYINKAEYFKEKNPNSNGWFYLSHKKQMEDLCLGERVIRKYKQLLISKGILNVKMMGLPAKEYLKINRGMLGQEVTKCKVLGLQNERTNIDNKEYKEQNKKEDSVPPSSKDKIKEYIPLAKQLSEIIVSKKNIKITQIKIQTWANDIRKLIETDEVSYSRVRKALNFYSDAIGGKYIPVIESGSSLREKFIRLENAMENDGYKKTDKNESSYVESIELADKFKKIHSK